MSPASPIFERVSRTGTATGRRCIPMRVPPMSIPRAPWMDSTTTGSGSRFQAVAAKLPPALGWGITQATGAPAGRAALGTTMARFRCSQHWAAR